MVVRQSSFAKPWSVGMSYQCPTCQEEKKMRTERYKREIFERVCMDCFSDNNGNTGRFGCKVHRGSACMFVKNCHDCNKKDTAECYVTKAEIEGGGTAATHSFCPGCLEGRLADD